MSGIKRYGSSGFDPYMYTQSSGAKGIADDVVGAYNAYEGGKALKKKLVASNKKRKAAKKLKNEQRNQGNLNRMPPGAR